MDPILSDLRIVELVNPYEQWNDPLVRELFDKTTTLKFEGYGQKYPKGVIPTDAVSWFCDHLLVCRELEDGLQPIMGFQRVTLERCRRHYRSFSPISISEEAGDVQLITKVKELVSRFEDHPHLLSYTGCFTIAPELGADPLLVGELLQMVVALHYYFHKEEGEGHEFLTAPITNPKMDVFWLTYGLIPLLDSNGRQDAPTLKIGYLAGEETRLLWCRKFNENAEFLAEEYLPLWENRLVIRNSQTVVMN